MTGMITGLLGAGGISKYLMMGMAAIILIGGGLSYWYYKDSQDTIRMLNMDVATLEANEIALEGAIQDQNNSILLLEKTRKIDQVKINSLSTNYRTSRKKVNDLRRDLSKHDIGYLAQRKPGLVEKVINKGTKELGKEFERLSQPDSLPNPEPKEISMKVPVKTPKEMPVDGDSK